MSQHRTIRGIVPCIDDDCINGLSSCECEKCPAHCEKSLGLCSLDNGLLLFSIQAKKDSFDTLIKSHGL